MLKFKWNHQVGGKALTCCHIIHILSEVPVTSAYAVSIYSTSSQNTNTYVQMTGEEKPAHCAFHCRIFCLVILCAYCLYFLRCSTYCFAWFCFCLYVLFSYASHWVQSWKSNSDLDPNLLYVHTYLDNKSDSDCASEELTWGWLSAKVLGLTWIWKYTVSISNLSTMRTAQCFWLIAKLFCSSLLLCVKLILIVFRLLASFNPCRHPPVYFQTGTVLHDLQRGIIMLHCAALFVLCSSNFVSVWRWMSFTFSATQTCMKVGSWRNMALGLVWKVCTIRCNHTIEKHK